MSGVLNLGHEISRDTVANILRDHGIEPAPERGPKTTWAKFLKRQWEVMSAADFFTVEVWTLKGIVRYQVLFLMKLATREVHIDGMAQQGHGPWMEQIARNLTDAMDGFLKDGRFLKINANQSRIIGGLSIGIFKTDRNFLQ